MIFLGSSACDLCLSNLTHAGRLYYRCSCIGSLLRNNKFLSQVSVAMGCAARERNVVFASTLASFFTRAYDQLRMAAISESNINLCGSHCGLSTG